MIEIRSDTWVSSFPLSTLPFFNGAIINSNLLDLPLRYVLDFN
jgi:hypothetical protein